MSSNKYLKLRLDDPIAEVTDAAGLTTIALDDATVVDELTEVLRACDQQSRTPVALISDRATVCIPLRVALRSINGDTMPTKSYSVLWLEKKSTQIKTPKISISNIDGNDANDNNNNNNNNEFDDTSLASSTKHRNSSTNSNISNTNNNSTKLVGSSSGVGSRLTGSGGDTFVSRTPTPTAIATATAAAAAAETEENVDNSHFTSNVHTTLTDCSDVFYVIELKELQIGTWKIVSKMKGEITLIIDEKKQHIQYRWRRVSLKRKMFATKIIQYNMNQFSRTRSIKSALETMTGSYEEALERSNTPVVVGANSGDAAAAQHNKRKHNELDSKDESTPIFSVDWLIELNGPPRFFGAPEEPLAKTTTKLKSMSANEDIKARRGAADVADRFFESTDFTANEQATLYRRHSCHVEDKPAATLHQLLTTKPYLMALAHTRLFELPGALTFGKRETTHQQPQHN